MEFVATQFGNVYLPLEIDLATNFIFIFLFY